MQPERTESGDNALTVLLVDSDPDFLTHSCELIAEDGHRAWAAEDLIAAANFLADHTPDLLLVEQELLEMDGADPLGDLVARAPRAPTIILGSGPPNAGLNVLSLEHDIYGYHDKSHGCDCLRLWISAALMNARQVNLIRQTRQGMQELLEAVPHLHKIQSLDEVLETILSEVDGLVGCKNGFVAARMSDPVGKPPLDELSDSRQAIDDYVVTAANADSYPRGARVDQLKDVPSHLVRRAVEERSNVIDDEHGVLPLTLAEHVLGLAYLSRPASSAADLEVLQVFATQAAAAIRNAALYEMATVDSTTRVFRKAFTLDRLRETVKLAWRREFPVTALMMDIDRFKDLNDLHGHIIGDRALRYLGTLLKSHVRDSDIVGRFGGDEFLVVLIDANHEGARIVADRLYGALTRGMKPPEGVPPLKTSIGMVSLEPGEVDYKELGFPDFERVVEKLVAEADAAMYRAREEADWSFGQNPLTWVDFAI
jgi:diguanylate cyclase (GGDEF)-like protein